MYETDDYMSSLDRLIELAKKTGNTLIVHDSAKDTSFVLLDVDAYADLLETKNDWNVLEKHIKNKTKEPISKQKIEDNPPSTSSFNTEEPKKADVLSLKDKEIVEANDPEDNKIGQIPQKNSVEGTSIISVKQPETKINHSYREFEDVSKQKKPIKNTSISKTNWFSMGSVLNNRTDNKDIPINNFEYKKKSRPKNITKNINVKMNNDNTVFFREPI